MVTGSFKFQRFMRLFTETVFYCLSITLIFYFVEPGIGFVDMVKSLFPFAPHRYSYWFINKFLALLLLQPFLSKIATSITKRQYQVLLFIMLLLNTELVKGFPFSAVFDNGWSLPWFVTLFFLGGYIRLYNPWKNVNNNWVLGGTWLISAVIFGIVSIRFSSIFNLQYNQWFFIAKSLAMFMWIKNMKISSDSVFGRIIGFLSPNVLAVYLIHCQPLLQVLLISVGMSVHFGHGEELLHMLYWSGFGIAVIFGCTLIDKFRIRIFEAVGITLLIDNFSKSVDRKLSMPASAQV